MKPSLYPSATYRVLVAFCIAALTSVSALFSQTTLQSGDYAGFIGKNIAIRLDLTEKAGKISGQYFYEKVGEYINITGSVNTSGDAVLEEFAEKNRKTGEFTGKFVKGIFTGTWSKPNGGKPLPCTFRKVVFPPNWDGISGSYKRFGKDVAFIDVALQRDGRVKMQGQAFWYGDPKTGNVHTGEVWGYFRRILSSGGTSTILYEAKPNDAPCSFTMTLGNGTLDITNEKDLCGGMNVSFVGMYKRVGNASPKWEFFNANDK
jgi:hypothetical protein